MKKVMKRVLALVLGLVITLASAETSVAYAATGRDYAELAKNIFQLTTKKHAHIYNRAVTEKWTEATCDSYATQTWACSQYVTKNGVKVLCDEEVTVVTGAKLAHNYVSTATENSEGIYQCSCGAVEYEMCSGCKAYSLFGRYHVPHTVKKVAPKLAHTHVEVADAAVEATCTATGLTAGSHCATCGEVLVAQEVVAATSHVEVVDAAVEATCTATGLTEGKHCATCGEVLVAQEVVEAEEHDWYVVQEYAYCEIDGVRYYKCTAKCGANKEEVIPATGHSYVTVDAVAVTCTEDGHTAYTMCETCGKYWDYEVLPATGHVEVIDAAVEATCQTTGLTEGKHCATCGEVFVAQEEIPVNYNKHNYETVPAKEATCTEEGHDEYYVCRDCGSSTYVFTYKYPALGHKDVMVEGVAATCKTPGLTDGWHCENCGRVSITQQVIPVDADAHDWVALGQILASCEVTKGMVHYNVHQCSLCKKRNVEEVVHSEHNFVDHEYGVECTECKYLYPNL